MASISVLVLANPYPPCADTNRDGDPVGPVAKRAKAQSVRKLVDDPVAENCDPDPVDDPDDPVNEPVPETEIRAGAFLAFLGREVGFFFLFTLVGKRDRQ